MSLQDIARVGLGASTLGISEIGGNGGLAGKLGLSGGRKRRPEADLNDFGLDRNSKTYAADTQAYMTRANWARSRSQLRPLIDSLNYSYSNPTGRQEAVQEAGSLATQGVDQARGQFARDAKSQGLSLAPDQQAEVSRQFSSAANVAGLDAKNRASRAFDDQKNQIALG